MPIVCAAMRDRRLVYSATFLRALATGAVGVLIGIHLVKQGLDPTAVGAVLGAGLAGCAVAALLATFGAERVGRRRFLFLLAVTAGTGGLTFALSSNPILLAAAAFVGLLNGNGRDRGAGLILEQAILPGTTDDRTRTRAFAWYNACQDGGHALGALLAGLPAILVHLELAGELTALRLVFGIAACLVLATAPLALLLSPHVEPPVRTARLRITPESRRAVTRISLLFLIDSAGGGLLLTAAIAAYFEEHFHASLTAIGVLFLLARAANASSHYFAARLASRIGLVKTMVFTHIPSSLLVIAVLYAPSFWVAAAIFLVRETLVQMDVPARQSYVMAVVRPEERVFASGVTNCVRLVAWAIAPFVAGYFLTGVAATTPLLLGIALKVLYDLILFPVLLKHRPPEEKIEPVMPLTPALQRPAPREPRARSERRAPVAV
jgi:MFS family permease